MGIKLNVGISKKIGLPDYGSAGSQCNLEIELDSSALERPEEFHRRVQDAYAACRSAVEDELRNHRNRAVSEMTPPLKPETSQRRNFAGASDKQAKYAVQLAGQVKGLGLKNLDNLCEKMYRKPFASLTGLETSNLIDTLREVKSGRIELAAI